MLAFKRRQQYFQPDPKNAKNRVNYENHPSHVATLRLDQLRELSCGRRLFSRRSKPGWCARARAPKQAPGAHPRPGEAQAPDPRPSTRTPLCPRRLLLAAQRRPVPRGGQGTRRGRDTSYSFSSLCSHAGPGGCRGSGPGPQAPSRSTGPPRPEGAGPGLLAVRRPPRGPRRAGGGGGSHLGPAVGGRTPPGGTAAPFLAGSDAPRAPAPPRGSRGEKRGKAAT